MFVEVFCVALLSYVMCKSCTTPPPPMEAEVKTTYIVLPLPPPYEEIMPTSGA
jgi:hypothetical protein